MAAISSSPRRPRTPPAWIGTVGIALGTVIGAAACLLLVQLV